ncbi:MAG: hypothetical protein VXZ82_10315 [Planctomycetota bacterium]|nr:hypothetical protein [Planctomycetota bacterium]
MQAQEDGGKTQESGSLPAKLIGWLLRLMGVSLCCAFFPIFFPMSWMVGIHRWLGLGEAPTDAPIFEYLARSNSAMYFAHGLVAVACSMDVRRFLPIAYTIAALNIFAWIVLFCTDLSAGMPSYWTWLEGPPICAGGIVLGWLCSRVF